ncbi:MAG: DEAD/DEAH box helicase [Mariprofundaceae bacterium]|nr:DEAD/DEAH box helicase [Mariprofundaceae bacterium]
MTEKNNAQTTFSELNLIPEVLRVLNEVGYETPTPIQARIIPFMMDGRDVLGQAQTGTGKTAAFALPILSRIDLSQHEPQVLVLAPTRELAIQVAEAFQKYAHHLKGFHVLPIYGGQDYGIQLRQLTRGTHVVVGTPGRVMDHMRRGTLKLDGLKTLVLDEADEMLRMGFIDDVKWVLEQTPPTRQIALFSATMPSVIRKIAEKHLNSPEQIAIEGKTTTALTIRQRYWTVSGRNKMDVLTRILEAEPFDGMIIFVRTKTATVEVAEKLEARGYAAAALNGDIAQKQREQVINRLKKGHLDIVVATDVAARGLDVERISHVINYDVPHDTESYVHRIGRTGRAGRSGEAILFVAPREQRMLSAIERATRQKIEKLEMPTTEDINDKRIADFKQRITDTLAEENMEMFSQIVEQYTQEHDVPAIEVAAALAHMVQGDRPLLVKHAPQIVSQREERASDRGSGREPRREPGRERPARREERTPRSEGSEPPKRVRAPMMDESHLPKPDRGMERYRLEVGDVHGVKAGNIVGAIANEIGIEGEFISRVNVQENYTTVDLPEGMPKGIFNTLKKIRVAGQELNASKMEDAGFSEGGFSGGRGRPRKPMGRSGSRPGGSAGGRPGGRPERKPRDAAGRSSRGRPGQDKKRPRK